MCHPGSVIGILAEQQDLDALVGRDSQGGENVLGRRQDRLAPGHFSVKKGIQCVIDAAVCLFLKQPLPAGGNRRQHRKMSIALRTMLLAALQERECSSSVSLCDSERRSAESNSAWWDGPAQGTTSNPSCIRACAIPFPITVVSSADFEIGSASDST